MTTDGRLFAHEPIHVDVTSEIPEDPFFAKFAVEKLELLGPEYKNPLSISEVELDGRFLSIRTQETALGNFVADARKLFLIQDMPSFVSASGSPWRCKFAWRKETGILTPIYF